MGAIRRHKFISFLCLIVLGLIAVIAWQKYFPHGILPIKDVKIAGNYQQIAPETLKQQLLPLVSKSYFTIDVNQIRQQLLNLPWVATAFAQRIWPDKVVISFTEQHALARWNDRGLVNSVGAVFYPDPATYPAHLPTLLGPDGQSSIALNYYTMLQNQLAPYHLSIDQLTVSERRAFTISLNNGLILLLGRESVLPHLQHFLTVYSSLPEDKRTQIAYMDLRYANGVAIGWLPEDKKKEQHLHKNN